MSDVQIYYTYVDYLGKYKNRLSNMNIDLDISLTRGDKTIQEIYDVVNKDEAFCRDEKSISRNYLLSLIQSDITLYADIDDKITGVLCFAFNKINDDLIINFNGICSPFIYSKQRVGENLIKSLITLARVNGVKYIKLECKGSVMQYYRDRFGFQLIDTIFSYDSDEDSDDEKEPYYFMRLDLSKISGGNKKKNRTLKKTNKRRKRKSVATRKRNLRK